MKSVVQKLMLLRGVQTTAGVSGAFTKRRVLAEAMDMLQLQALKPPGLTTTCETKGTAQHEESVAKFPKSMK